MAEKGIQKLGQGRHTYELVEGWGRLPAGKEFGYTHGVAVDSRGRVFIHNQSEDAVAVFDADGNFLSSWGAEFKEGAHGMQYNRETDGEFFYLADIARRCVIKTTLDGEEVWRIEWPKESGLYESQEKFKPTNVAIAPSGDVYVTDGYGQSYVHQYSPKAQYIRSWGGRGDAPGKLMCPHGIGIDTRSGQPRVLVADRGNARLQYFSLTGEYQGMVTEELRRPGHFDFRGEDLLIPDLFGRITIFDSSNRLITHLGDTPNVDQMEGYPNLTHEQRIPCKFISPHAAVWDADGNIYVVEWISDGRVTKLRRCRNVGTSPAVST